MKAVFFYFHLYTYCTFSSFFSELVHSTKIHKPEYVLDIFLGAEQKW